MMLTHMEGRPLPKSEIGPDLEGSGATIADLLQTRIIRQSAQGYVIGFNYFTLSDVQKIHATAQQFVPSLVAAYKAHARDFDRIFERYPVKSIPRKRLATIILAGFALNWDGLDMTARLGYRAPQLVRGPGWKYSFFASEEDPSYSEHGFIWGSSSFFGIHDNFTDDPVDFQFTSFGDPYSDPRMNFPDLFDLPLSDMSQDIAAAVSAIGTRDETYFGSDLKAVLGPSRARSVGPMLFALRKRPLTASELATSIEPQDRRSATAFIDLLVESDYIRKRPGGRYELIAPVFDTADGPMLHAALSLHRQILGQWLKRFYPKAKRELSGITAVRQGVPFGSAFTHIWHEYFGFATRQMVTAGLIEDPYAKARTHPGSLGVLWRRAIYDFDPG